MNIFNDINKIINNCIKEYPNKKKIIFNLDKIVTNVIVTTIKPYIEFSKKLR